MRVVLVMLCSALAAVTVGGACGAPHRATVRPQPVTPPVSQPVKPPPVTQPVLPPQQPPVTDPGTQPATPDGSWGAPLAIAQLPASVAGDTSTSTVSTAASYSPCAPMISEGGPELVYTFIAPAAGIVTATLDDASGDARDVDVQLLTAADPATCIARDNIALSHSVTAGTAYFLAVDSYENLAHAGPFILSVTFKAAVVASGCPADTTLVQAPTGDVCMDTYEAPNSAGALPLVMFDLNESEAWCDARGKRLCFDDEWSYACGGAQATTYPYGNTYDAAKCNTNKTWIAYAQSKLNYWPSMASAVSVDDLQTLYANASAGTGATAVGEVERLYQAEPSGSFAACTNSIGVYDMVGSVEEWTRRRDGGTVTNGVHFSGNLKGRYWAEERTCFGGVTTHADPFRFYEIGFRCCQSPGPTLGEQVPTAPAGL